MHPLPPRAAARAALAIENDTHLLGNLGTVANLTFVSSVTHTTKKAPPMAKFIRTEHSGRLLTVTISRPEVRNALNAEACRELSAVWDEFEADADSWVAIVTGEGEAAFCAGHDLTDESPMPNTGWAGLSSRTKLISKPLIAAVNGNASEADSNSLWHAISCWPTRERDLP